jgi:uncharacterized protein
MLLEWFPARRHRWFDVTCCPTNLARMFATVHHYVSELTDDGDLLIHLPLAARISGGGWDVEVVSEYPEGGDVDVTVHATPAGRWPKVRVPLWAGGSGHVSLPADRHLRVPLAPQWWETDPRVEGAVGTVFLRYGPVLHCVESVHNPGLDLDALVVDPTRPPSSAFCVREPRPDSSLHHPFEVPPVGRDDEPRHVVTVPYHSWANRGPTAMRMRFPCR